MELGLAVLLKSPCIMSQWCLRMLGEPVARQLRLMVGQVCEHVVDQNVHNLPWWFSNSLLGSTPVVTSHCACRRTESDLLVNLGLFVPPACEMSCSCNATPSNLGYLPRCAFKIEPTNGGSPVRFSAGAMSCRKVFTRLVLSHGKLSRSRSSATKEFHHLLLGSTGDAKGVMMIVIIIIIIMIILIMMSSLFSSSSWWSSSSDSYSYSYMHFKSNVRPHWQCRGCYDDSYHHSPHPYHHYHHGHHDLLLAGTDDAEDAAMIYIITALIFVLRWAVFFKKDMIVWVRWSSSEVWSGIPTPAGSSWAPHVSDLRDHCHSVFWSLYRHWFWRNAFFKAHEAGWISLLESVLLSWLNASRLSGRGCPGFRKPVSRILWRSLSNVARAVKGAETICWRAWTAGASFA